MIEAIELYQSLVHFRTYANLAENGYFARI